MLPESITNITYKLPYLHWSDFWGSGRGKTWTFSLKMFGGMDILHKLFGVGPDAYLNAVVSIAVAVGYICHNFFCYQQVCSTPFVFMFMS